MPKQVFKSLQVVFQYLVLSNLKKVEKKGKTLTKQKQKDTIANSLYIDLTHH